MSEADRLRPSRELQVAAFLCDTVIKGADGVLSAIRIIDRSRSVLQIVLPAGEEIPDDVDQATGQAHVRLVAIFRMLPPNRTFKASWQTYGPSFAPFTSPNSITIRGSGEHSSANVMADIVLQFTESGTYWVVVRLDDQEVARVPLELMRMVDIKRIPITSETEGVENEHGAPIFETN